MHSRQCLGTVRAWACVWKLHNFPKNDSIPEQGKKWLVIARHLLQPIALKPFGTRGFLIEIRIDSSDFKSCSDILTLTKFRASRFLIHEYIFRTLFYRGIRCCGQQRCRVSIRFASTLVIYPHCRRGQQQLQSLIERASLLGRDGGLHPVQDHGQHLLFRLGAGS